MRKNSESEIQSQILNWVKSEGILIWRCSLGGVIQGGGKFIAKNPIKGFPDLAGVLKGGKFFTIEVKTPKGKLSSEQFAWQVILESQGVKYCLARSLEDAQEFINEIRN